MKNDLKERTKLFAHNCFKFTARLPNNYLLFNLKKQLIRSSTSMAANYRATCFAQSKASFISKLSIVLEETDETLFWLEFLRDEKDLKLADKQMLVNLIKEANELVSIFVSSRKTAVQNK